VIVTVTISKSFQILIHCIDQIPFENGFFCLFVCLNFIVNFSNESGFC
jgi:hypothetical protein